MQKYKVHSTASIGDVLPLIEYSINGKIFKEVNGTPVKVNSLRLQTFAKYGTKCCACGLEATHFELNKDLSAPEGQRFHLNLWGAVNHTTDDGYTVEEPMLFTHDHIVARALGGKDSLDNTQTMCSDCNHLKSLTETKLARNKY